MSHSRYSNRSEVSHAVFRYFIVDMFAIESLGGVYIAKMNM